MATHESASAPQHPPPAYELEWETRSPRGRSFIDRLLRPHANTTAAPAADARETSLPTSQHGPATAAEETAFAKEAALGAIDPPHGTSLNHSVSDGASHLVVAPSTATTTTRQSPFRTRLDALLPPQRRYLGLRRRAFLVLLTAVLLLVVILAVGLGAGLSSRGGASGPPPPLPLPGRDSGATHTGDLTFYEPALGACGWTSSARELVAAVAHELYDAAARELASAPSSNPNENPLCGRRMRVSRGGARADVDVVVVDRCTGCQPTDVDLSPAAFGLLAREEEGRVVGSWRWL